MSHIKNVGCQTDRFPRTFRQSLLPLCILAASQAAWAQEVQDNTEEEMVQVEEVVVMGMRQSLENAQDIKRDADTFVDAVTASDIGALPDRSVLEAMQRLPGVSIERFAAADDPDHFSVEGSGAVIRGMTAVRSEFNGRDSFSANTGRGLSFQDVPPELMQSVNLYKNQTADMIEGGIGGTVSLRTRKPFDQDGRMIAVNAEGTWGDLAEELTPTVSALYSDRWDTSAGEFGFLVNLAYSELLGVSHGIQSDVYKQYDAAWLAGAERFVGADGEGAVWIPQGSNMTMKEDYRERQGLATSFQWQDHDGKYQLTAEYIRSKAILDWWENAIKYQGGYTDEDLNTRPWHDTQFTFDDDGMFVAGMFSQGDNKWRGPGEHGPDGAETNTRIPNPYSGIPAGEGEVGGMPLFGHRFQLDTRGFYTETLVEDASVNFKWQPTDAFSLTLDYQHVAAEQKEDDLVMAMMVHALQQYTVAGDTPSLRMIEPWGGTRDDNPEAYNNGVTRPGWTNDPQGDANYFQDSTSYFNHHGMDHYDRSEGTSDAFQLDLGYAFDNSVITDVKGGVRWAERDQTINRTGWGWGAFSPWWSSGILFMDHVPEQSDWYEAVDFSDFHRGDVLSVDQGTEEFFFYTRDVVSSHRDQGLCQGEGVQYSSGGTWQPYKCRDGVDDRYGIFLPDEVSNTIETNTAAYVRVDFALEDAPLRVSGNVGLRYVKLEREATGFVSSPGMDDDFTENEMLPDGLTAPLTGPAVLSYAQGQVEAGEYTTLDDFYNAEENNWTSEAFWYLNDRERAFATDGSGTSTAESDYDTFLPSLNIKMELTEDLISRFAVSKAIAMPDMGDVRNTINTGAEVVQYRGVPADPENAEDWQSAIQTAEVNQWTGGGGNPFLMPMESTQVDLSLEWYFDASGSLTSSLFYKDLNNFFVHGASLQSVTNPKTGATEIVDVVGMRNGGEGELYGFEIAYTQFFDQLPEPFDGLGMQANYTYISASGVPNSEESYEDAEWVEGSTDTGARVNLDTVPLQGQSDHTANLVLMYEKSDWSARVAYNWRSKYLLTTRDVISKYPLWNDDYGYMDASVFYNITDDITVGIQASNLLNAQAETIMILDNEGTEAGRSWFIQDRRASLVLRAKF